jgi:hypothetical protein
MPEAKNGLVYYYGYRVGATEGDNDFFIVIEAEEENPQNGKPVLGGAGFAFIDGTTDGISAFTDATAVGTGCTIAPGQKPACAGVGFTGWEVLEINSDGEIVS